MPLIVYLLANICKFIVINKYTLFTFSATFQKWGGYFVCVNANVGCIYLDFIE